jgi:integrase
MRRKRFQRGSLKPRKRNGKNYWYAQWREDGQPRSKELGLCSKLNRVEAEALLAEILQPVNTAAGQAGPLNYTFAKFVEEVYLPVAHRKWKSSTGMTEENRIQVHLVGTLGARPIKEITREDMQSVLDKKAKVLAQSCLDHLRFRLRSIFELALSEGIVDRNPATTLFTPRKCKASRARRVLSLEEASKITEVLDVRERLVVRLATWEGMRPGEVLALQVGDIEPDCVWVRRRLYRGNVDTPKTKRSERQVAMTQATAALLRLWLEMLPSQDSAAWLFPSEGLATPIRRDNIWRRSIEPKLKTIGFQWANFQVMRRTFATLSKQAGVDAHTRSAQMGNTVDVNENEYAVSKFEDRLAAVRRLESAFVQ